MFPTDAGVFAGDDVQEELAVLLYALFAHAFYVQQGLRVMMAAIFYDFFWSRARKST